MSTIVYRDGVMAADSKAWPGQGEKIFIGWKDKAHVLPDGSLIGISAVGVGLPDRFLAEIRKWMAPQDDVARAPRTLELEGGNVCMDVQAVLVEPDGRIYYWNDSCAFTGPLETPYIAIGSGADFALTAMDMGADAPKAVEMAILRDKNSGGPVRQKFLVPAS